MGEGISGSEEVRVGCNIISKYDHQDGQDIFLSSSRGQGGEAMECRNKSSPKTTGLPFGPQSRAETVRWDRSE